MEIVKKSEVKTPAEVSRIWKELTGKRRIEELNEGSYLTANITRQVGENIDVELYVLDSLNGKYKLVVDDFSSQEGDEHYIQGVETVADFIFNLKAAGVNIAEFEVQKQYSDSQSIKEDIEEHLRLEAGEQEAA